MLAKDDNKDKVCRD